MTEDNVVYRCGSAAEYDKTYCQRRQMKIWLIPMVVGPKLMLPIVMAAQPKILLRIAMVVCQTTMLGNTVVVLQMTMPPILVAAWRKIS
jgi:hypothetical protein